MATSKSLLQRRFTAALIIANVCVFTLYVSGWSSSKATNLQGKEKVVTKSFALKNQPVEVTDLKIKGKAADFGKGVHEDSDWLKDFSFKLKNKSSKPVTYAGIHIDFPETKETGSVMMHVLVIGRRPDHEEMLNNPPLNLQPSESKEISLASEYDQIKKLIEAGRLSIDDINRVVIRVNEVMFDDGTRYTGGFIYKRNPDTNARPKWIQIPNEQQTSQSN